MVKSRPIASRNGKTRRVLITPGVVKAVAPAPPMSTRIDEETADQADQHQDAQFAPDAILKYGMPQNCGSSQVADHQDYSGLKLTK